MAGFQLYIDAGHGGTDPGTVHPVLKGPTWAGDFNGPRVIHEAHLTALAAPVIESLAKEWGIKTFVGPTGPRAAERVVHIREWGEKVKAEGDTPVVVSVHWNSANDSCASGCEVLVRPDAEGKVLEAASEVNRYLAGNLSWHYPVRNRGVKRAKLAVIGVYPQSSMLVEVAFLSNAFECFWWAKFASEAGLHLLANAILQPVGKLWGKD